MSHEFMNKCYQCVHRYNLAGDCHSGCNNFHANAKGAHHGVANGWFFWPINFDPVWLEKCDGFKAKDQLKKEDEHAD